MVVHRQELRVTSDTMTIPISLWSPNGDPANIARPLLVVHDGPEYEARADLLHKISGWVGDGSIGSYNVALLAPDDANNIQRLGHYAASDAYSTVLLQRILPELERRAPVDGALVGMGASMGALAMLHSSSAFDGLFLQSASIHHPDYGSEQEYKDMYAKYGSVADYEQVKQFVEKARQNLTDGNRLTISMTCGDESNYEGNKAMFYALRSQGHEILGGHVPNGGHNFESWGGNLKPHLKDFLVAVAGLRNHR